MTTALEIANIALSHIGKSEITSLSDTDNVSKTCNRHIQQAVDWVLRAREWRVAITRATLTTPGTPEYGWEYSYTIPADCLRVLDVRSESLQDDEANNTRWSNEDGKILCDVDTSIKVKYLARLDEEDIPSHIIDVIGLELARRICIPITNSKPLKDQLTTDMFGSNPKTDSGALAEAAAVDGMQRGRTRVLRSSAITKVRTQGAPFLGPYV